MVIITFELWNLKMSYPQYRKYTNNKAYFKIVSDKEWEEIRVVGDKHVIHSFVVKILPDRNLLHDMTFNYQRNWVEIMKSEYEEKKITAKSQSRQEKDKEEGG